MGRSVTRAWNTGLEKAEARLAGDQVGNHEQQLGIAAVSPSALRVPRGPGVGPYPIYLTLTSYTSLHWHRARIKLRAQGGRLNTTRGQMEGGSSKPLDIAIVGGGIGGVVLALSLLHRDIRFTLYESAKGFEEIGAGVSLGPNSVRGLELISPELLAALRRHASFDPDVRSPDVFATLRHAIPPPAPADTGSGAGDPVYHLRWDGYATWAAATGIGLPCAAQVHRAHFLKDVVRMIPAESVAFNKTLTAVGEDDNGVRLSFADGTSAWHGAVVGCDGVKSTTRRFLHGPEAGPQFAHEYAYRALVPVGAFKAAMGSERTASGQIYVGASRYIITYPIERGRSVNMVAIRIRPGSEWPHKQWLAPSRPDEALADFEGWNSDLVGLLVRYGAREKWPLFHYPHNKPYAAGYVCLLGDSAHSSTPHLGGGAGQAIEDAYVLGRLLSRTKAAGDVRGAFAAYDAVRRPRSQKLIRESVSNGLTFSGIFDDVGEDLDAIGRATMERFNWLWSVDLEAHAESAIRLMEAGTDLAEVDTETVANRTA